jgi:hypothetical protein
MSANTVHGAVPEKSEVIRQALSASIANGVGIGASLCSTKNGVIVVDIRGGYGGSPAIIDMDNRATNAYAMNRMLGTTTGEARAFTLAMPMWA